MNLRSILDNARSVSKNNRKLVIFQLYELLRLRLGASKLGADDYYLYELYDDNRYTFSDKSEFLGWRVSSEVDQVLNSDDWRIFANDKVQFHMKMAESGFRTPKIIALFNDNNPPESSINLLTTPEEAREFLLNNDIYPVFMKPVHGTYGRGGFSAVSVCKNSSNIQLGDGSIKSISGIVNQFREKWAKGYIIQELLTPHPEVEALVGRRLSSLRVIVLRIKDRPHIFRVVWKLPTGRNMSDNFMHGELGNLIANVNPQDGVVTNIVGKVDGRVSETNTHPDTGRDLSGISVPLWPEVVKYCEHASDLFSGLSMQHWDIAICTEGPVALELNVEGSLDLHQLAAQKGVYTEFLKNTIQQNRRNFGSKPGQ